MSNHAKGSFLEGARTYAFPRTMQFRVLSGSLTLLAGSGLVSATNLTYNIAVARLLGPTGFAHATAVYTLLMLLSAITLSFQVVCAKLVANHEIPQEKAAVYAWLHRRAWQVGMAIAALLILTRSLVSTYLNLPSPFLIVLLALGTAFYIPLGVRRGCIQGVYSFNLLAANLVLEGVVRLGGAFVLIGAGLGVNGAVLASIAGVVLAYLFALPPRELRTAASMEITASFREGLQAIVFFAGQVVINNFDIILVKHFFPAEEAGLYAAVSLVGRLVYMCAWSVVSSMFPLSAGTRSEEREGKPVLVMSLLLVASILVLLIAGLSMVPNFLWDLIFGAQFELPRFGAISSLLVLYAVTTSIYSLSAVIISYEMSRKIANTGWVQLAFSGIIVLGIYAFHDGLRQVILVQLTLMLLLLAIVLLPFLRSIVIAPHRIADRYGRIRRLSLLTEDAVITEFLKNEFHHQEFDPYRRQFEDLVSHPDLANSDENALRRALLFLRRGAMWRELPDDTQWFEVALTPGDLARIRVFPRGQWRRFAQGSFYLTDIVERIRDQAGKSEDDEFFRKLRSLSDGVREEVENPAVLLIGVDDRSRVTVLDGNHRMAAAMLASPSVVLEQFRFICGFSPKMIECCWYQTNMTTLWRYAKNLVRYLSYDPGADIDRFLQSKAEG